MPVTPTFPGVYIEEIPSGVRTITGVATSIAAFAGWAPRGPTDRAQLILSWQDFERNFGTDTRSNLAYSVYHFFANGGSQAYVIRLLAANAKIAGVTIDGKLNVTAKNAGDWANTYAISTRVSSFDASRFTLNVLQVVNSVENVAETFSNLSMDPNNAQFVAKLVSDQSEFVNVAIAGGATTPPANTATPSPKLGSGTPGAPGDLLAPDTADFETALLPVSGTGGLFFLDRIDLFNLLVVPGESKATVIQALQKFCRDRRAFLVADSAPADTLTTLTPGPKTDMTGADSINSALYFPWVIAPDPFQGNLLRAFPPSGFVAGVYARTDAERGVWKAPAGTDASISGATGLTVNLTNAENGVLNPQAINVLRNLPVYGNVVWGARTLQGNDQRGSEWKYVPVRRLALFLEESLYRGTQWVVFEPNDEPLWAQIRLNIGAFMQDLFRQGAFQGRTPKDAYFVKCDKETTTQNDINNGIVNIIVGFAPLKPAEFVIIKIQQMSGQIQV
jgi:phage tail sheath protein FI